jgi:hypothetical protein
LGGRRCHGHSWTAESAHRRCVSVGESPGERAPADVISTALTDRHPATLAAGTLAAVRVPGLIDPATCAAAVGAAGRLPTADYDPACVSTPILRFGPALNDYCTPGGELDAGRYGHDAEAAAGPDSGAK